MSSTYLAAGSDQYSDQTSSSYSTHMQSSHQKRTLDPYEADVYNGFSDVTDPAQYMDAPSTLLPRQRGVQPESPMILGNPSDPEYFNISPLLNYNDPMTLHFMVQSTIADAKGFKILSYQEVEDLKNEQQLLYARLQDIRHKMEMEVKLRDAASSLSKLHLQRNSSNGGSLTNRRSFLKFNNNEAKDKKRHSRHAEEELEVSNRRLAGLQQEHFRLTERYTEASDKILHHSIGILAFSHGSYSGNNQAKATQRMKHQNRISSAASQATISNKTNTYMGAREDQVKLEGLIATLTSAISSPTVSARTDTDNDSSGTMIDHVSYLCQTLISNYESSKNENEALLSTVHDTIRELDPNVEPGSSHVRDQLINSISTFRQDHQRLADKNQQLMAQQESSTSRDIDDSLDTEDFEPNGQKQTLLKRRLDSMTASYEGNRRELEQLEIENVDLRTSLRDTTFKSQAKIQELENELKENSERILEWRERCDGLQTELESVVKSLEDVTRQAVDYESERAKLESQVGHLEKELFKETNSTLDRRVSMIGSPGKNGETRTNGIYSPESSRGIPRSGSSPSRRTDEPTSVSILRHEFRKIVMDINSKHTRELKNEQIQRKKLESLLRSIKHSSYAINIPPAKLEALELSMNSQTSKSIFL